jgi:hypothetical protein
VKKKIKIELSQQNYVDQYEEQVKFILKTLGHPEALVTDETLIWDLLHMFDSGGYDKQLAKMSKKVGFSVEPNDVLWKVAKKIKYHLDIEIGRLTNSILNCISGDSFPTDVHLLKKSDLKKMKKNKAGYLTGWKNTI